MSAGRAADNAGKKTTQQHFAVRLRSQRIDHVVDIWIEGIRGLRIKRSCQAECDERQRCSEQLMALHQVPFRRLADSHQNRKWPESQAEWSCELGQAEM